MAVLIDGLWRFVLRPLGRARLRCLWCWRRFCGSQDQVLHVFVSSSGLEKCHWKWLKRPPPPQEGCVRCVCISDTHLQHEDLHLPYGEILLHCGDVLLESRGLQASALEALRSFHRWIEQQPHQHKLLVAGNHDGVLQALGPERVQEVLPKCTYLQDQGIDLEGLKLYASPLSMGQSPNAAFQSHGGYDERAACEAIPEGLDLLITHGPAGQGALGRASAALAETGGGLEELVGGGGAAVSEPRMFSSTSALLGLSRSADYSASNANLNCLINFRRTNGVNGQSNMWGEIAGTGLAGGGTGAAGKHGDTSQGATAASEAYTSDGLPRKLPKTPEPDFVSKYPPSYYHRDPARSDFVVSIREGNSPLEIQHKISFSSMEKEGFIPVRGLQDQHDGVCWALKRGEQTIGPVFTTWTHDLARIDGLCMPWLDDPGRAGLECEYSVCCRLRGSAQLSQNGERRQLAAIRLPNVQVASAESCEALAVQPGQWYDVPGLTQISYTENGEKVLVFCTIRYTALWSDEMTRGRFSIFRDGQPLDPEHFGLQSVRAMQKGLKSVAVMTFMDDPQEGPHVYEVKAAVTTENGQTRVCHVDAAPRQLGLLKLPANAVFGPERMQSVAVIEEDQWCEVKGLSVTVTTKKAHEKVLLVWSTNFNPEELTYEAYFTVSWSLVFRSSSSGLKNLGGEEQGLWSVASSASGSSEYPASMSSLVETDDSGDQKFRIDAPGVGTFTYTVYCRSKRCGSLPEPTRVELGPDGHIAAALLNAKASESRTVVEMMGREMDAARSEK
ncbi:unnamed protein product [Durusdinium trenchii]|uniref:Ketoreductase (KR) domain-containing protein n=1 Tax=Durusdinium trenchii TaxID=1381693 RepID=A0ABP0SMN7_9DINO